MASFSALPPEIISLVADFVSPSDIISFAISSKTILRSSERALQKHRQFLNRYHVIGNQHPCSHGRTPLWPILREMIVIPQASLYVTRLNIELGDTIWDHPDTVRPPVSDTESRVFRQPLSDLGVLREMAEIQGVELEDEAAIINEAADSVCRGDDRFTSILLLCHLPNLTSLDLAVNDNWGLSIEFLVPMLRCMAANDASMLTKLYTVRLKHLLDDWMQHMLVTAFMSFPSVHIIHAEKVTGPEDLETPPYWSLPLSTRESNLSTLIINKQEEIIDENIDPIEWLHELLTSAPRLKTFKWWCQGPDSDPRYNTTDIIAILVQHVAQSLEELFIKVYDETQDLQNLRSLLVLHTLEISYGDFLPRSGSPALDLFQRLPPNLQHLKLWDTDDYQLVRDLNHLPDMIRDDLRKSTLEKLTLYLQDTGENSKDSRIVRALTESSQACGITTSVNFLYHASMPSLST